jgi:type II secretory pathway pseudopilin PulG
MSRRSSVAGFTLLEVIFITALIGLLSAMAVPTVFRSRIAANETSAFGTVRSIHTAQLTYALTCGYGNYASQFTDLGPYGGLGYLPPDLTAAVAPLKSGYNYVLQPGPSGASGLTDCNGNATALDYYVAAEPASIGGTGRRAFASNQAHMIWQDLTGVAPVEPFTAGGTTSALGAD